jgi:DNA-directed RNA polymerase specialized sigma24 family protein
MPNRAFRIPDRDEQADPMPASGEWHAPVLALRRAAPAHGTPHAVESGFVPEIIERAISGDRFAAEVVARWAAEGDVETWSWILRESEQMAGALLRRATGRTDRDMVEDLAQQAVTDVYVMLRENRFDYARAHRFHGLLRVIISRTIAKCVVRRAREHRKHREHAARLASGAAREMFEGLGGATAGVDRALVERAVSALKEPERTAVLLHARGLSLEQIGEQIGYRSKSGVRKVVRRGLMKALESVRRAERAQGPPGGQRSGGPEGGGSCRAD